MRCRSSASSGLIALSLILMATPGRAAELDPAKIPLSVLDSWAKGEITWKDLEDRATGKAPSEPDKKAPEPEKKPEPGSKPETPAKPEPKAVDKWTMGNRRPEPAMCSAWTKLLGLAYVKDGNKLTQNPKKAYDFYRRFDQIDNACRLVLARWSDATTTKNEKLKGKGGSLEEKVWNTVILSPPQSFDWRLMDEVVMDWSRKREEANKHQARTQPKWNGLEHAEAHRKRRLDYYHKDGRTLPHTLRELDLRGDNSDPRALWELCVRYADARPYSPVAYVKTLYKLREWYKDYPQVKSGEVQWRLAHTIHGWTDGARRASPSPRAKGAHWSAFYKLAHDETMRLIEACPKYHSVARGEALWSAAEARRKQGDEEPSGRAVRAWKDAYAKFQAFQKQFSKHWRNKRKENGDPSDSQSRLNGLVKKFK